MLNPKVSYQFKMPKQAVSSILLIALIIAALIGTGTKVLADNNVVISGEVVESLNNTPLAGVQIQAFDQGVSTFTDSKGQFSFTLTTSKALSLGAHLEGYMFEQRKTDPEQHPSPIQFVLRAKKKSAATKRWEQYLSKNSPKLEFSPQPGWSVTFRQRNLKGDFAPDREVTRRDPSAVINVNGLYYVWYSRGTGPVRGFDSGNPEAKVFPWDKCDIYFATSRDGVTWQEQGPAVRRGLKGQFDDRSVFTPEILAHDDKYYLVYQAVKAPYTRRVKNTVAIAWAESPDGPWTKLSAPILEATHNGIWDPSSESRLDAEVQGDFDSHKVHDPTLLVFNNKFYLYYKGERMGEKRFFGQREIKWGVAIADQPFGPYVKSEYNPITNTGHELVIWQYDGGIALINTLDGPERGTVQWAQDGLNFSIMGYAKRLPHAQGLYRNSYTNTNPKYSEDPLHGASWGLSHVLNWDRPGGWMHINRFEIIKKK